MHIKSVTLKNFRNYGDENVELSNNLNIIYGSNASGKTNLVEAVYYAALGKSPRTSKDKDLIKWGSEYAYIRIELIKKHRTHILELHLDGRGNKRILVDRLPIKRLGELIGILNIVFFSPDEMSLVKAPPEERRRFMDISLSQQSRIYFNLLSRYNHILSQRNKTLKTIFDTEKLRRVLPVWDEQLADAGANIAAFRYDFIDAIKDNAAERHSVLSGGKEVLEIAYESKLPKGDNAYMRSALLAMLENGVEKDSKLGYTTEGIHRDDLSLIVNGVEVRKFGSQGQQRTAALSLKTAEIFSFVKETGETPILLLDDVLSELDKKRREQLLISCEGVQTLLTATELTGEKAVRAIEISSGRVVSNIADKR